MAEQGDPQHPGQRNLQRYTTMDRGGHFPAIENPDSLAGDIGAFFGDIGGR